MIRTERVMEIPREVLLTLTPYSAQEYALHKDAVKLLIARSELWVLYEDDVPLACGGLLRQGFIGAELWFLLCTPFKTSHMRYCRRFLSQVVKCHKFLRTDIEDGYRRGDRFACFFGFVKTEIKRISAGRTFHVYEVLG